MGTNIRVSQQFDLVCSKFVLSQHPLKLLPFMQFVFSQEDLVNFCKPEWITLYDAEVRSPLLFLFWLCKLEFEMDFLTLLKG